MYRSPDSLRLSHSVPGFSLWFGAACLPYRPWGGGGAVLRRLWSRPDLGVLRECHREHHGLLVDLDAHGWIARAEQELAPAVDVLALFDPAEHATTEDVVAEQDGKRRISAELVAKRERGDLPLLEGRSVADVRGRVGLVITEAQLALVPERANDLILPGSGLLRR